MTTVSQNIGSIKPKKIETELGTEKLCIHCNEYWPLDTEFWFSYKAKLKDGSCVIRFESACKCCYHQRYKPKKLENRNPNYKIKSYYEKEGIA